MNDKSLKKNSNLFPKITERLKALTKLAQVLSGVVSEIVEDFDISTKQINELAKDKNGFVLRFREFMDAEAKNFIGGTVVLVPELEVEKNVSRVQKVVENEIAEHEEMVSDVRFEIQTLEIQSAKNDQGASNDIAPKNFNEQIRRQEEIAKEGRKFELENFDDNVSNDFTPALVGKPRSIELLEEFSDEMFGIKADFSGIKIPSRTEKQLIFNRLMIMSDGIKFSQIYNGFGKITGVRRIGFSEGLLLAFGYIKNAKDVAEADKNRVIIPANLATIYSEVILQMDECLKPVTNVSYSNAWWSFEDLVSNRGLALEKTDTVSIFEGKKIPTLGLEQIIFQILFDLWILQREADRETMLRYLGKDYALFCAGSRIHFGGVEIVPRFACINGGFLVGHFRRHNPVGNNKVHIGVF